MTENILDYCGGVFGATARGRGAGAPKPFAIPGDTAHYARDRVVDVEHIKLDIDIDMDRQRIKGVARTTFRPINDGALHVEFDAVEMEIESVQIQGRRTAARYTYDGAKLRIELGRGRKAGERITTVVRYSATPRRGLYFVAPDEGYPNKPQQVWSQGQDEDSRHWFPCVDFPNEMATSEVAVTVPKPLIVVSNGRLAGVSERGRKRTYRWRQDQPHVAYLLSVAAGDFAEIKDSVDGLPIQYYVPKGREADGRRALSRTPRMLRFFSDAIGIKYPYAKYAQVVAADFIFGGMENISATTLTENVLQDRRAYPDFFDAGDGLVAHELAHQWFGDLLTCRDWAHGWLNEGFATYFDALFTEHQRGVDEFRLQMRRNGQLYMAEDAQHYRRPIVSNTYTEPIDLFDRQFYEKGSWALHMLRHNLGDDLFWKAIRHYAAKHRGGNVTTPDLQRAIEESTGRNLDEFFEQWLYGAGHPQLTVAFAYDATAKQGKLTVKQTQTADHGSREVFRTPVDVSFRVGRRDQNFRIHLTEREQSFYFPLAQKPRMVRFDPGGWLLKTLAFKRDPESLTYQLKNDDDVIGRIDAAAELAKLATAVAVAALKAAVTGDGFWGVQAEAARGLGRIGTPEALEALLDCVSVDNARARRAAAGALGSFRDEAPANRGAAAAEALQKLLDDGDPSYYVEAEAAAALGRTRSQRAFATLERAMAKRSHNDIIRVRALEGLAELRDERALPIAVEWTAYGKPYQARDAAATCLSKTAKYLDKKEPARDRLTELLDDPWLRTRLTAISALVHLGDVAAIPALERLAARELDGRVIRTSREAITKLREGVDKGEEVKKLRDELDKLREDQRTLRDRLTKMESKPRRGTAKRKKR